MSINLTKDGMDWATCALDPFHDFSRPIEGLPDQYSGNTIVQCHRQTVDVATPSAGTGYSMSIQFTGVDSLATRGFIPVAQTFDSSGGAPANETYFAPVMIMTNTNANNLNYSTCAVTAGGATIGYAGLPLRANSYDVGRLIAIGIEVVDTSPELYRQGTCTAAMFNDLPSNVTVYQTDTSAGTPYRDRIAGTLVPSLIGDTVVVARQPKAVTWQASKGLYMVPRYVGNTSPTECDSLVTASSYPNDTCTYLQMRDSGGNVTGFKSTSWNGAGWDQYRQVPALRTGFLPCAATFTGLNALSSFRIILKTYVEYMPRCDSTLVPLTTPAAPWDPSAFTAYADAAAVAPFAVPVGMNPKGEYWQMILKALGKWAPRFGMALGSLASGANPALGLGVALAGKGIGQLAKMSSSSGKPRAKPPAIKVTYRKKQR